MAKSKTNIVSVEINRLVPNKWNPNKQSEFIFEKEMRSIERHGCVLPPIVRKKGNVYEIIDGEHRWMAAKQLKMKKIDVNCLEIDEAGAQELTILMNELKGSADPFKMGELLKKLSKTMSKKMLEEIMPFSPFQLDSMLKEATVDWDKVGSKLNNTDSSEPDKPGFATIKLSVPIELHDQFEKELMRFKMALHPDKNPKDVSHIAAFEAMLQHIAQIPDEQLV